MNEPTTNQTYHLILADIAMIAVVRSLAGEDRAPVVSDPYVPGNPRDAWLAAETDRLLTLRVKAAANAGLGALLAAPAAIILKAANETGVPMTEERADEIAEFFQNKRDAVLRYRR